LVAIKDQRRHVDNLTTAQDRHETRIRHEEEVVTHQSVFRGPISSPLPLSGGRKLPLILFFRVKIVKTGEFRELDENAIDWGGHISLAPPSIATKSLIL
jgi:hypothetical protein